VPSIEWNKRVWGATYDWPDAGDEWSGMAAYCGQPYEDWKRELIHTFIEPVPVGSRIVEIAPGYGRWTEHLLRRAASLALVDINPACLDHCRERFSGSDALSFHLTDGCSLAFLQTSSTDFVWSFDSFVHMEPEVVEGYIGEIARVLAPRGRAVVHHAGKPEWSLSLAPVTARTGRPGRLLQRLVSQRRVFNDGERSNVSAAKVARWARAAGLEVTAQVDSWGEARQYTVRRWRDRITLLAKPG
jgi:ubiquinone/menaquinone biosynthesis C-methylase UbiE